MPETTAKKSQENNPQGKLDPPVNYIVSGLERSGTSMMMQMLANGGLPVAFDDGRKPDEHNPKGYYELDGGKIITRLMQNSFRFEDYKGRFIKITAFGLLYLPPGSYKIIYMQRNLDEVLDSMETMAQITDTQREETKQSFQKLNEKVLKDLQKRNDVKVLLLNYNEILQDPATLIAMLCRFLAPNRCDAQKMTTVIDKHLYRQRR